MAKAGTYGAYTQLQAPQQGGFAGAGQIARIAQDNAEKARERREEQRTIAANARKAVSVAIEAQNVDLSKFDEKTRKYAADSINWYQEKKVDLIKAIEKDPSFKNQIALDQLRAKFTNNLNSYLAVGGTITSVSQGLETGKYDAWKGSDVSTKQMEFITAMPTFDIDPETMVVNGTGMTLSELYKSKVDLSQLVAPIQDEEKVDAFVKSNVKSAGYTTSIDPKTHIKTDVQNFEFDENSARGAFKIDWKGTPEFSKKAAKVLDQWSYLIGEDPKQAEEFFNKYININKYDGEPEVTLDGLFDFIRDTEVTPFLAIQGKGEYERPPSSNTYGLRTQVQGEIQAQKEMDTIRGVDEAGTQNGTVMFNRATIMFKGKPVEHQGTRPVANPESGVVQVKTSYAFMDAQGEQIQGSEFYSKDNWRQEFGRDIDPSFDYNKVRSKLGSAYVPMADVIPSVAWKGSSYADQAMSESTAIRRAIADDEATTMKHLKTGAGSLVKKGTVGITIDTALQSYMAGNTTTKSFDGGEKLYIGNVPYSLSVEQEEGDEKDLLAERISTMNMTARQMRAMGYKDGEITEELKKVANMPKGSEYEFSPVARYIKTIALDESTRNSMTAKADAMYADNASDKEVRDALSKMNVVPMKDRVATIKAKMTEADKKLFGKTLDKNIEDNIATLEKDGVGEFIEGFKNQ